MFIPELVEARRQLRAHVREVQRNRRRVNRELRRIQRQLRLIVPNETFVEAIEMLRDLDYVWRGDFDEIREPLAELIVEVNRAGLFPSHIDEITRILLRHGQN
jgi:hypothetical protein